MNGMILMSAWKIQQAHKWVMKPYTALEMRNILNVRESRHTVMIYDRKYYDADTCKFNSDKINTLYSSSLSECSQCDEGYTNKRVQTAYFGWKFVPKDDDFDF